MLPRNFYLSHHGTNKKNDGASSRYAPASLPAVEFINSTPFMQDDETTISATRSASTTTSDDEDVCAPTQCNNDKYECPPVARRRRLVVKFHDEVQCQLIPSCRDDFSDEERSATWLTRDEMNLITRKCCLLIKKMETNKEDGRFRGLESHAPLGSLAKSQNRKNAIQRVLLEQSRGSSSVVIAQAYRAASSGSQLWASVVALRDHRVVECFV